MLKIFGRLRIVISPASSYEAFDFLLVQANRCLRMRFLCGLSYFDRQTTTLPPAYGLHWGHFRQRCQGGIYIGFQEIDAC